MKMTDISAHKFSDTQLELNTLEPSKGDDLSIYFTDAFYSDSDEREDGDEVRFEIDKGDVIALVKHFGLTAEDIK